MNTKKYWTQVLYKKKEQFLNPIHQNYGHVKALENLFRDFDGIQFIPIIVFSTSADFKIKVDSEVVYTTKLLKTIKKYTEEVIKDEDV